MPGKRARQPTDADNTPENHSSTDSTTRQRKSPRLQDEQPSTLDMNQEERRHSAGSEVAYPERAAATDADNTPEKHCSTDSTTPQRKSPSTSDMIQEERRHRAGSEVADPERAAVTDADNTPENHCSIGSTTPQRKSPSTSDMNHEERRHRAGSEVADPERAARRGERSESEDDRDKTEEHQDEQPPTSDMSQEERRHRAGSEVADPERAAGRGERSGSEDDRDKAEELEGASTTETPARRNQTFRQRLGEELKAAHIDDYFPLQCMNAEGQLGETVVSGIINADVTEGWEEADNAIMNFTANLARCSPGSWDDLEPGLREELLSWTPRAQEFFGDPHRAGFLYAARIWRTLDEQVISADVETSREFLGPEWSRVAEMKESFKTTEHDRPWKWGKMEAAYHMWRWYTAGITHFSMRPFPTDKLADVATRRVIRDLVPLVGATPEEAETWTPKIEIICNDIAKVVRARSLTHSKTWVTWKPKGYGGGQSGFPVSSATDEGWAVMMRPWWMTPWMGVKDPAVLNGSKVHLVVSPAVVGSYFFRGDLTHHYMAPMTVIVDGHLWQGERKAQG